MHQYCMHFQHRTLYLNLSVKSEPPSSIVTTAGEIDDSPSLLSEVASSLPSSSPLEDACSLFIGGPRLAAIVWKECTTAEWKANASKIPSHRWLLVYPDGMLFRFSGLDSAGE